MTASLKSETSPSKVLRGRPQGLGSQKIIFAEIKSEQNSGKNRTDTRDQNLSKHQYCLLCSLEARLQNNPFHLAYIIVLLTFRGSEETLLQLTHSN